MATIVATFDTKAKTLDITVNGKAVSDVAECYFSKSYRDEDSFSCGLTTMREDKDDGAMHVTRLVAAESKEAEGKEAKPTEHEGLVEIDSQKVENDIHTYFGIKDK